MTILEIGEEGPESRDVAVDRGRLILCRRQRLAVEPQPRLALALGRKGRRNRGHELVFWRLLCLDRRTHRLAQRGARAGAFSARLGDRGPARQGERITRLDLSLGRGTRREQSAGRHATRLPRAL